MGAVIPPVKAPPAQVPSDETSLKEHAPKQGMLTERIRIDEFWLNSEFNPILIVLLEATTQIS